MFKLFTRDEIDPVKWDECITSSKQGIIYGLSWYLDVVSPRWIAYIKEENNQYSSVLPCALNKKFSISYIYQPSLTQQLGLFSRDWINEKEDLEEILSLLSKKINYIDYHLNTKNRKEINLKNYTCKQKLTHHLPLNKEYQSLHKAYSENHKRNLRKSVSQNLQLINSEDISFLISVFQKEKGATLENVKESDYIKLSSLFRQASKRNLAKLIFAKDSNNEVQAGGFFLYHLNTIIYLFGASSEKGKQQGAMTMIFDQVIRENSGAEGQGKILDFEGSDIENIARFYKGFGAEPVPYLSIKLNTLPFFIKLFKR
jgi:hypothetical protein